MNKDNSKSKLSRLIDKIFHFKGCVRNRDELHSLNPKDLKNKELRQSCYWNAVFHDIRYSISDAEFCVWITRILEDHLCMVGSNPDQLKQAMDKLVNEITDAHKRVCK